MTTRNLVSRLIRLSKGGIMLLSLLTAIVFIVPNPANLSDGETQSTGCVTIKAQYNDGCPRTGALVYEIDQLNNAYLGTTDENGTLTLPGLPFPNTLYYFQVWWPYPTPYPPYINWFSEAALWTDENGHGSTTAIAWQHPNHPNAFIMNLTSPTNYVTFAENALNDSSTTKDLTFGGNESKTVWITLPKQSTVLDAELTLSACAGLGPCPTNPYLDIGNDSDAEWSYIGEFNRSQVIQDLSSEINEYLSNATANVYNQVDVPIILHSDTVGTIQISNININYLYNATYLYDVSFVTPLVGYSVNRTAYYNPLEVCIQGFYIDANSTTAKVDGVQHAIEIRDGYQYVEFVELVPVGSARPWNNHNVWWDTLSAPAVHILSPENRTYNTNSIDLNFTVNEPTTWMGYSLDGQDFQTISGNTTLNVADGSHNIMVNVTDGTGDSGTSERVHFTISTHDVSVTSVSSSHTEAIMGQVVNITVRVKNEGIYTETFNVTTYYDENPIQTQEVTNLTPAGQANLTFNWNTIGIPLDVDYTIKAEASAVTNETDLADNTLTDGTVIVKTVKTVEVTPCDQTGNPKETFETGTIAYFKVKINNTASEPANILITVNVYDSNNTAIGVASFQGPITPGISIFIISIPIPASAHIGNATVYANAYTDWPHNGGAPYCPEVSAIFQITEVT